MEVLSYFNYGRSKSTRATTAQASSKNSSVAVGLQSLIQLCSSSASSSSSTEKYKRNVVLKSALRAPKTTNLLPQATKFESCYLKTCSLCHKKLSLHKDVYMYRGDQGFCSIECRDRQIFLDETKEAESKTKHMLKYSYKHCSNSSADESEIRLLREELSRRRQKPRQPHHQGQRPSLVT
ncbi:hypothetical protein K2173_024739 [Erythroxylum novogranatense]|uniref:FLZ-type domain-containing protein n=1 Tax=Erythroxylum novogranatense TaxID=1862640 RepID=A0AAV8SV62_9ROSI|nr:hypothetical protein K2173_024739 [Erythroxylum novogranatense]